MTTLFKNKVKTVPDILEIPVTQTDIDLGQRNKCHSCPIALALDKMGHTHITVWGDRLSLVDKDEKVLIHYNHSPQMVKFIHNFDTQKLVKPATLVAYRA